MTWDDSKSNGPPALQASEWNAMVTDQKTRLVGSLGLATPNTFIIVNDGGTGATPSSGVTYGATPGWINATEYVGSGQYLTGIGDSAPTALSITVQAKVDIKKGQAVFITPGSANQPDVDLCDITDTSKSRVLGIAYSNISAGAPGLVVRGGTLLNVDTRTSNTYVNPTGADFTEGDLLFVGATPGTLTKTRPTSGRSVKVGYSVKGSSVSDAVVIFPMANPAWVTAAANEDVVLRLGDESGTNKVSVRDYANNEVASIDSDGKITATAATQTYTDESTNVATTAFVKSVRPKRTLFLSLAGGVPSTTYGDGGFTTTECSTTSGATPSTFNMRGTQFDAAAYDRHHEFGAPMPYNWDGGTVSATPFVMCSSIPAANTILIVGIAGAVIKHGEAATACSFSVGASCFFALSTTDRNKVLVGSAATPSSGVTDITLTCNGTAAGGDWVQWKVSRAGYDTYAGNATVLGWIITYGTDDYEDVK